MMQSRPQINIEHKYLADRQSQTDTRYSENTPGSPQTSRERSSTPSVAELDAEDCVIVVMGPTGSGKSTFVRVASGLDTQGADDGLRSFTNQVEAVRFWHQESGRHVVLVDMPGFDDTSKSDLEILEMISNWLTSSYKKGKLLSGILYLHRILDNRMAGTPLKNLRLFRKLCGKSVMDKVWLTTTMWDEIDPVLGENRLEEIKHEFWKPMISQGAQVACCRSDNDSPKQVIQQILDREASRKALQLQEEIVNLNMELKETEAGQELHTRLRALVERQMVLLERINAERKAVSDENVLAELQKEYNNVRAQIDEKLRQMQELKLSRFRTLRRLFSPRRV